MVDFGLTCFNTCILRNFGCSILRNLQLQGTFLLNPKIGWIETSEVRGSNWIPIHQAGEQGARFGEQITCFNTMISGFPR